MPPPTTRSGEPWSTWLYLAGRGAGKTRACVEWVLDQARRYPGSRGCIIARTAADVRDTAVWGESGIVACSAKDFRPRYVGSQRRIEWPNGSQAMLCSAEKPDAIRGPQYHWAWCDELASWRYLDAAWASLQMALRLGERPRCAISTTPRPIKLLRELLADEHTVVTRSSTRDNILNLSSIQVARLEKRYGGSRLGRQELEGEILDDYEGALWSARQLDETRVNVAPACERIVVAVDPAVSSGPDACEHGIVAAGRLGEHYYVLSDHSLRGSPLDWAKAARAEYRRLKADAIVGESNQGGDLVRSNLLSVAPEARIVLVHATRGKYVRAEPIASLYEQGRVHHVGQYPQLEDQMIAFTGAGGGSSDGHSPDRVDALVWALTSLLEPEEESAPDLVYAIS